MTPREDTTLLDAEELLDVLREHEGPPEPRANGAARLESRRKRPQVRRVALLGAAVAAALLLGSGLGFGLGASVTPSGAAGDNVVGFGFLPARNWYVVQSGAVGPGSEGHAIASNVPLRTGRDAGAIPDATLESLAQGGIVIATTFGLRGDPGEDFRFPAGSLPLLISDAELVGPRVAREITQYGLRVGVGGFNVDARIYFGGAPTPRLFEVAQRQLERLVVASEQVTIAARPTTAAPLETITLFGSVESGRANEKVEIQAKDCGQPFFRLVAATTTTEGGGWSIPFGPGINTAVRAVWKEHASSQVALRQRARLEFRSKPFDRTRFVVSVVAQAQFWRKRVLIQRFDRLLGKWQAYRSVVLTDQDGPGLIWTSGEFTARVPKGSLLRAVLPASQAGPCYLSGTSRPLRT